MNRLTKILSLFLLSLVGMTAMAQDYAEGNLLTTPEEVVSQKVLLWAPGGIANDHPSGYMCGTQRLTETLTNDCVVEFVKVEGEADGHQLYALRQVSTGLYFMDPKFVTEPTETAVLTKNLEEAFKMTILPFEDHTAEEGLVPGRNTAVTGNLNAEGNTVDKQDLTDSGFILTRDAVYDETDEEAAGQVMYLASFFSPVYSPYMDTNVWNIYSVKDVKGAEKLNNYLAAYFNNGVSEVYPAGSTPGSYKEDVVARVEALVSKVNDIITEGTSVSDAEADELCAQLKAAYEEIKGALIPLSEGYYFINNDANRYFSTHMSKGVEFLWALAGYQKSEPLAAEDVKQIWYVTPGDTTTHFYVQNLYSKNYINGDSDPAETSDGDACYTLGQKGQIGIALEGQNSPASFLFFEIKDNYNDHGAQFHAKFDNRGVMTWAEATSPNNCFHFTPVSKEDIEAVLKEAEQAHKNELLQAAYDKANSVYNSGFAYAGAPVDSVFTDNGGLVAGADQLFSDSKDPQEGSFEGLLDGNFTTFFHSDWHNPNVVEFHSIGVDLKKSVEKAIQVKMCKRLNTVKKYMIDYPVTLDIYASNDTTDNKWTKVAEGVNVNWATSRDFDGTTYDGAIGYAAASYEGAYQYFKFVVKKTDKGNKFFAISEMNVYQGKEDSANSTISQVSKETRSLMEAELAKAKKELDAKKATDETIKSLNDAYDKFVKELPVPALLADAVKAAAKLSQEAQDAGAIGEEIGCYPEAALGALNTAINAAKAYDTKGKSATEINAEVAKVEAAMDAFKASLKLPTAGKYYAFRGMSEKSWNNQLTSYKALVYSKSNTLNGGVYFTRPEGAQDGVIGETDFNDTIDLAERFDYVWYVEKAEAGKIVLRNVANGMYFAPQKGEIHQSATPFEIQVYFGKKGVFVLDAGEGKQVNANAGGSVVTWADIKDQNAWWTFEELQTEGSYPANLYWEVAPGQLQIITLPVTVDASGTAEGTAYSLVGQTEDNKLALVEVVDPIEAGTPFIFNAGEKLTNGKHAVFTYLYDGEESISALKYVFEPVKVAGLKGTICEADTAVAGQAYFAGGKLAAANKTVIGNNSGYFDGTQEMGVDGSAADMTLELGKINITSIDDAKVVVLPSVVDVYSINGTLVRKNVKTVNALKGLPAGLYIVGGQKMIVK